MFPLVRVEETMLTRFLGPASSLNIRKCLGSSLSAFFLVECFLVRAKNDNKQVGLEKSAYIFPDEGG